ncbi:putative membrane protein [Catalinimonas alkaloidigena]|uniref:SdpI family protein n=1 Tax=Catalinimonas alkaloidigena TaxID=1075417 RepID=UPI002407576A|nr:SdpI family protein [Catalinimonas alkaloidigena]MDF9799641.1 putative membrane protein [Catalinimonas alkaloidigena]
MKELKLGEFLRKDWLALLFLLLPLVLTLSLWNQLPERFATHWGLNGEANGYQDKTSFLIFLIAINLFTYAILSVVPYIDPKPQSKRLIKPLRLVRMIVMAFLAVVMGSVVLKATGYALDIILIAKLCIIALYLVLGNMMSKFPPNYFAGIRTPWTLESPEVWRQVHRVASKLWVSCSLVLLLFVFRLGNTAYYILFAATTLVLIFFPIIHSYLLYRKTQP